MDGCYGCPHQGQCGDQGDNNVNTDNDTDSDATVESPINNREDEAEVN